MYGRAATATGRSIHIYHAISTVASRSLVSLNHEDASYGILYERMVILTELELMDQCKMTMTTLAFRTVEAVCEWAERN